MFTIFFFLRNEKKYAEFVAMSKIVSILFGQLALSIFIFELHEIAYMHELKL